MVQKEQGIQLSLYDYFADSEDFTLKEAEDAVLNLSLIHIQMCIRDSFLINPDEKSSMDSLARLFIDEIYRVLSFEANKTGGRLPRKFHYFWDETASTGKLNDLPKKLSISRGRNQQWHLYLQDFGQLEEIYGKEVTQTIKAHCNLMIYISTQNLETAKEISDTVSYTHLDVYKRQGQASIP